MPKLIVPIGIPGCGKSTWGKLMFPTFAQISTDGIRKELFGSLQGCHEGDKRANNGKVFDLFYWRVEHDLYVNMNSVYADNTSLYPEARQKLIDIARKVGAQVHAIVFDNVVQGMNRNTERPENEWVPQPIMLKMMNHFWTERDTIRYQDFDTITFINGVENGTRWTDDNRQKDGTTQ